MRGISLAQRSPLETFFSFSVVSILCKHKGFPLGFRWSLGLGFQLESQREPESAMQESLTH